ncbi:hypothetical protein F5B21DRAFT_528023 [Xylaria acuta]|nr:hypothetical protein F5B21DRAFT_528023 [Xylaria acuta]
MDNQMLSSVDTDIIPTDNQVTTDNQITTVNRVPEHQTTRGSFGALPPEIWLMIKDFLGSKSDICRLSRVDKSLFSLLTFARAKCEAQMDRMYVMRNPPSMLYTALKRGRPLDEIKKIVAGYVMGYTGWGSSLLETDLGQCWEPPLHLAVRMNRFDVVELLLHSGVRINIKWGGHVVGVCPNWAHVWCDGAGSRYCKNALDIARESKNPEIEQYLLIQGIEDLGRDELIPDWMDSYVAEAYSPCDNWWPAF